jgi:hypothetical protein
MDKSLDAAWIAAEKELPEGRQIEALDQRVDPAESNKKWQAEAWLPYDIAKYPHFTPGVTDQAETGYGNTPASALHALARELRHHAATA